MDKVPYFNTEWIMVLVFIDTGIEIADVICDGTGV